jgi:hypothetical protein
MQGSCICFAGALHSCGSAVVALAALAVGYGSQLLRACRQCAAVAVAERVALSVGLRGCAAGWSKEIAAGVPVKRVRGVDFVLQPALKNLEPVDVLG